ncbi:hypothetical protein [Exiguobacterium aestuarii]|uniref:hypothetical protein n=1 Tax=Exiguobacterium aestuarii TaxID=273527 RepID=UPI001CD2FCAC|nr:hypothetical protein [Exiguobacterium aestuarii]MCA0981879.1 hypothetical protein [Exiguobacterium aestuarii]
MNQDGLTEFVESITTKEYLRPFVSKYKLSKPNVFVVGINPASSILKIDVNYDVKRYIDLITDRESFLTFIQQKNVQKGKKPFSKTRIGLNHLVEHLETKSNGKIEVLETNINAYPTKNAKQLKAMSPRIQKVGQEWFRKLMLEHAPPVVIVHSLDATRDLMKWLKSEKIISPLVYNRSYRLKDWIDLGPIPINYPCGARGVVFCTKHLKYYGRKGNAFQQLRDDVLNQFKEH